MASRPVVRSAALAAEFRDSGCDQLAELVLDGVAAGIGCRGGLGDGTRAPLTEEIGEALRQG